MLWLRQQTIFTMILRMLCPRTHKSFRATQLLLLKPRGSLIRVKSLWFLICSGFRATDLLACYRTGCQWHNYWHTLHRLVGIDASSIEIHIGATVCVRVPDEAVQLVSGQVITAMPPGILPHLWGTFEDLMAQPDLWGPSDQFPRPLARAGICLLHEGRRFFVNRRFYPGQPANEAAAQCAGLTPSTSIMRVARSPALDNVAMHGNDCKGVACVVGVPPPPTPADSADRGDNVLFFDLRPLLQRPIYHYQIGQTRHWPTVLSSLGVYAPRGMQLQIEGASHTDGFVNTPSGHTIVVHACLDTSC